ncbi:MAG: YraN family protein [Saprospiraceae bacterium]
MAKHIETGRHGEELAVDFLEKAGFQILETNWRHRRLEVDIIAKDGETLVFVEVKTRSYDYFGRPEEFVDKKKERHLSQAAAAYMEQTGHEWAIRFDVVSVLMKTENEWLVEHLPDAFWPGIE